MLEASTPTTGDTDYTSAGTVPELITSAGEQAVALYARFFGAGPWRPNTRKFYGQNARRFFRWAESRALTLATISASEIMAYAEEIRVAKGSHVAGVYLTPVRGLFRLMASEGLLSVNPFDMTYSGPDARPVTEVRGASTVDGSSAPVGDDRPFPLLSVMAMLAYMEEKSLERIFKEDWAANALIEFVCWRDGRLCTRCGAAAEDQTADSECEGTGYRCRECGEVYAATDGSPFEGLPLRHSLFILSGLYLRDGPPPGVDSLAQTLSIEVAAVIGLALRLEQALARDGLASGASLRQAVERRNRELTQDEVTRGIIEYAELAACRDTLIAARATGDPVSDLPPGVTLVQAIDQIAARIAEHDRYVIALEDGYLVSRLAQTGEGDPEGGELPGDPV